MTRKRSHTVFVIYLYTGSIRFTSNTPIVLYIKMSQCNFLWKQQSTYKTNPFLYITNYMCHCSLSYIKKVIRNGYINPHHFATCLPMRWSEAHRYYIIAITAYNYIKCKTLYQHKSKSVHNSQRTLLFVYLYKT